MKEKIKFLLSLFTRIVTAIVIFDNIILLILRGADSTLHVTDNLFIVLIALACTLMYIPFLTEKVLSKRKMIFMNVLYFAGVNIVTLGAGYFLEWFSFKNPASFVGLESVIVCAYVLVMIFFYRIDASTADRMNEKLRNLKEKELEA